MSSQAARVFLPVLRQLEGELALPIPDRVRILRELEYDLEELRRRFLDQGLGPEEASRKALEALVPDGAALRELGRLHRPFYRRMTGHLSHDRLKKAERWALAVATGVVVLAETAVLLQADLLRHPSPFLWAVLGLGGLLFAAIAAKVFQLWIKGDHNRPDRGLGGILGLAGLVLATGFGGTLLDLFYLAGVLERNPDLAGTLTPVWLVRDSALLSVSILISLAGALAWFILSQWLSLVSGAHRDLLGLGFRDAPGKESQS